MGQIFNFLLFDGFSNHCLANMVEPLRAANTLSRQKLYTWNFFSPDGHPVKSSSGLQVSPNGALQDESGDVLVVMPSYGFVSLSTEKTAKMLRASSRRHGKIAGLDTGSWLLARAGLLDNCRATIHWDELSRFEEEFPNVETVQERFVIDGNLLTCMGAMAAFDLASALIREDHGALLSMEVANLLMNQDAASQYSGPLQSRDTIVNRILTLMQNNIESPMSIQSIAKTIGCSQKKVETRVRASLETTPQALYRRLRLNLARKLASETDQSIAEIASRCGYDDASAMTRAFRAEFGQTPSAIRNASRS